MQSFLVAASTRDPAKDGVLLDVVCDSLKDTRLYLLDRVA